MAVDKLVDSTQLDADLTSVANAIRAKGGTSAQLAFPAGFVSAVEAIPTGGGGYTANDLLNGLVGGSVSDDSTIFQKRFNFIGQSITSVNLPNVTTLKTGQIIGQLSNSLFAYCPLLTTFSAPQATNVVDSIFQGDTSLISLTLTKLVDTGGMMCYGCTALPLIVLPSVNVIYNNAFNGCTSLQTVDIRGGNYIGTTVFTNCTKLNTFVIRKAGVCNLNNINSFNNTPFASDGSGGTLYVPSAQISSYQSATNWSTILGYANNSIKAIEGSIYETQYADGTPVT